MEPKTLLDLLKDIRNPETRREGIKTLVIGAAIASLTIGGAQIGSEVTRGFYQVVMEYATFPLLNAEIDSLRLDLWRAPCQSNLMLLSKAAEWNMRIAHEKQSNTSYLTGWASPNTWNRVQRIEHPCH